MQLIDELMGRSWVLMSLVQKLRGNEIWMELLTVRLLVGTRATFMVLMLL